MCLHKLENHPWSNRDLAGQPRWLERCCGKAGWESEEQEMWRNRLNVGGAEELSLRVCGAGLEERPVGLLLWSPNSSVLVFPESEAKGILW